MAVVQGKTYFGTQALVVTGVHVVGGGSAHFSPAGQGAEMPPLHSSLVCAKHTMPLAQSALVVHGPGTHSRISMTGHGGGVGQF
jgi:hypothetical protein